MAEEMARLFVWTAVSVCVCETNSGTLGQCLMAGLPCVSLPLSVLTKKKKPKEKTSWKEKKGVCGSLDTWSWNLKVNFRPFLFKYL